jgi:hypothetical protein
LLVRRSTTAAALALVVAATACGCEALVGIEQVTLVDAGPVADASLVDRTANDVGVTPDVPEEPNDDPCRLVLPDASRVYCGSSSANLFLGGPPDKLFTCSNGATTSTRTCDAGCWSDRGPADDDCVTDPCAGIGKFGFNSGSFCGRTTQYNFDSAHANPNYLYDCWQDGGLKSYELCPMGCTLADMDAADYCAK